MHAQKQFHFLFTRKLIHTLPIYWFSHVSCDLCQHSLNTNCKQPRDVKLIHRQTHTHTHARLTALFPVLPRWASTRKVQPIWILLKQETVSGSGISWAICKSNLAPDRQPRQHPTTQFFTGRPPNQQRQSTEGSYTQTDKLLNHN